MAVVMLQVTPSFNAKYSKNSLLLQQKDDLKYNVSHWDCLAHHDAETCVLPICSYRMILLGDVEEFHRKLNSLCFTHQHVDCLNRFFKYRFNGNFLVESGQVFDNVQKDACFKRKNSGMDRIRSIV